MPGRVRKLDRLARGLADLIARGVRFQSLTEAIDTEIPKGRAMWQLVGVLAELERSLIVERTRAGVKEAQRRGVKFGPKPKLTPAQVQHAREQIEGRMRVRDVAALCGVDRPLSFSQAPTWDTATPDRGSRSDRHWVMARWVRSVTVIPWEARRSVVPPASGRRF